LVSSHKTTRLRTPKHHNINLHHHDNLNLLKSKQINFYSCV